MKGRWFLATTVVPLTLLLMLGTAGCGGGGSDNAPTAAVAPALQATTRVTATVQWPERSRDIAAPGSAQSVVLVLRGARSDGSDLVLICERGDNDGIFTQEYTSAEEARVGEWDTQVRCYAAPGGGGDLVGEAAVRAPLGRDGRPFKDGIALRGRIASVRVDPGQEVGVGERKELRFTARTESGEVLALRPRAGAFTVVEGGDFLRIHERVVGEGVKPGEARVTVQVDGVTSPPETVRVISRVGISLQPERLTLRPGGSETFHATVTGTEQQGVTWTIREGSPVGGTITDGGRYTAPLTPGEYHVIATSIADPTKTAVAVVIVQAPEEAVRVSLQPERLTIRPGGRETFHATVTGTNDTRVLWSLREGSPAGGSITDGGRYTAPETPGEYHVVATSMADPTKSATAVVIVQNP